MAEGKINRKKSLDIKDFKKRKYKKSKKEKDDLYDEEDDKPRSRKDVGKRLHRKKTIKDDDWEF